MSSTVLSTKDTVLEKGDPLRWFSPYCAQASHQVPLTHRIGTNTQVHKAEILWLWVT